MPKTFAVHSYKGGTGKTSIAANLAVIYAQQGLKVWLLDYDFRAPSLHVLFKDAPAHWLNDYLNGECDIEDTMLNVSSKLAGKENLYVSLANPSLEEMREMMSKDRRWEAKAFQRTLAAKRRIFKEMNIDYLIFDTGPGAQYSSINALASSDSISLVLKADDFDIQGTKELTKGIYDVLGKKTGLLLNKVPIEQVAAEGGTEAFRENIESTFGLPILGIIPCFCELMALGGKLLYAIDKPEHTFTKSLREISTKLAEL